MYQQEKNRITLSPALNKSDYVMSQVVIEPTAFLAALCKEGSVSQLMLEELTLLNQGERRKVQQEITDQFLEVYGKVPTYYDQFCQGWGFDTFTVFPDRKNDGREVEYVDCEYVEVASTHIDPNCRYETRIYHSDVFGNDQFHNPLYLFKVNKDQPAFVFRAFGPGGLFNPSTRWGEKNRNEAIRMLGWRGVWFHNRVMTEEEAGVSPQHNRDLSLER